MDLPDREPPVAELIREAQNAMWAAEQAIRRAGRVRTSNKNAKRLAYAISSVQAAVEWLNEVET